MTFTLGKPLISEQDCIQQVAFICDRIRQFVLARGMNMGIGRKDLHRSIVRYIYLRQHKQRFRISMPRRKVVKPVGWTKDYEELWQDWMESHFDDWDREVMFPIFGTEESPWEVDGWRNEIFVFLPWWVSRSVEVLKKVYPSLFQEDAEPDTNEKGREKEKEVDSYLIENGIVKDNAYSHKKKV